MGGKSGGDTTTVQKADPWVEQQPYLKDIYSQAQGWYNTPGPHFFPEATNVPFSNQSELGLQMMQDRAQYGSPVNQTAQNQLSQTNAGGFLNSNPWLDRTYEMGARAVMPGINATFGGANRTGSNAHTTALGQGLGDLATGIYGGNYQEERGRQLQAASLSPALAGTDYQDIQAQLGAGGQIEQKGLEQLQDRIGRFNWYQNLPAQKMRDYSAIVQGQGYPGSTTQTDAQGIGGNPFTGAIGGGLMGAGLGRSLASEAAIAEGGIGAVGGWPFLLGGAALGTLGGLF
jgi:hypothetical protein